MSSSSVLVGAEQDAGHDRHAEGLRVTSFALARFVERLACGDVVLERRADHVVLVGEARRGDRGAGLRAAADDQRRVRVLHGLRERRAIDEVVVLALERDVLLGPEPVHDLDLLGEVLEPLAQRRKREPEGLVLELVPAGAHPELDPAARDVVDGRDGVREQRRVAEGDRRDERPEAEPLRERGQAGDRRPRVVRGALVREREREVVVGAEERFDPGALARLARARPTAPR